MNSGKENISASEMRDAFSYFSHKKSNPYETGTSERKGEHAIEVLEIGRKKVSTIFKFFETMTILEVLCHAILMPCTIRGGWHL